MPEFKVDKIVFSDTSEQVTAGGGGANAVISDPPEGYKKVLQLYYNPNSEKLMVVVQQD